LLTPHTTDETDLPGWMALVEHQRNKENPLLILHKLSSLLLSAQALDTEKIGRE
jgi:putative hemin transport protein